MKFKCKLCKFATNEWDGLVLHWKEEHPTEWLKIAQWLGVDEDGN